jgi:hypothetical protein
VTTAIVLFFAFGACFGLATFSRRHLFSEGPSRASSSGQAGGENTRAQRLIWVLVCSGLWPLMLLTGFISLWKQRRVRGLPVQRDTER